MQGMLAMNKFSLSLFKFVFLHNFGNMGTVEEDD